MACYQHQPVHRLPELWIVSPDVVVIEHIHSGGEDIVASSPQSSRHGDLLTLENA